MMRRNKSALFSFVRLLAVGGLGLSGCAAPAVPPTGTPRQPATATALPPTAAATAQGTAAFVAATPVAATAVTLHFPNDVAFDADGNLYVSKCDGPEVVKIDSLGKLTVFASPNYGGFSGDGGPAISAEIQCAEGVAFDRDGNLFVADTFNNRIRRIDRNGLISSVAGSSAFGDPGGFGGDGGPATAALLNLPTDVAFDPVGNLYIADGGNYRIRKVDQQGIITTVAGNGTPGFSGDGGPATAAQFDAHVTQNDLPGSIAFDAAGNLYIADSFNGRVRKVDRQGIITTIAGNGGRVFSGDGGPAISATLPFPTGLAFAPDGSLYVSSAPSDFILNSRIRKIDPKGVITTVAGAGAVDFFGDGGPAIAALFRYPSGIALDGSGNLYIADTGNDRVRKIDQRGIINTVVGGVP